MLINRLMICLNILFHKQKINTLKNVEALIFNTHLFFKKIRMIIEKKQQTKKQYIYI